MTQLDPQGLTSYVELLRARAEEKPEKLAYCFLSQGKERARHTYRELEQAARTLGSMLQRKGAAGERVLILCPPSMVYVTAFWGCLFAGAVAVPAYSPRTKRKLPRLLAIVSDCRPRIVLTTSNLVSQFERSFGSIPNFGEAECIQIDRIESDQAESWQDPSIGREDLAFLQYTSGSTSTPKGVMVSHGNLLANEAMLKAACATSEDTVSVCWLPLFHDMGLIGHVLLTIYNGCTSYLMPPVDFVRRPLLWLEAISRYRGTYSGGPNFGYNLCCQRISDEDKAGLDLSSWTCAFNGAEPVRAATLSQFSESFAPCGFRKQAFFPCFGLAEAVLIVTGSLLTKEPGRFSRSHLEQGRVVPAQEGVEDPEGTDVLVDCGRTALDGRVVIVDPETRRKLSAEQIGEIWFASECVPQGYWGRPETSEATFRARLADDDDEETFLRTGDLGFLHEGGLHIVGRLKDLIIVRGRNLYPQDIEHAAEVAHPALHLGCAAAFSVEIGGEEELALAIEIRPRSVRGLDADEVIYAIRDAVTSEYDVDVMAVVLLKPGSIPKTSSGKIQRQLTRKRFLRQELSALAQWRPDEPDQAPGPQAFEPTVPEDQLLAAGLPAATADIQSWLTHELSKRLKMPASRIHPADTIASHGLSSLATVELVDEIEKRFEISFPVEQLFVGEPSLTELAGQLSRKLVGGNDAGAPEDTGPHRHQSAGMAAPSQPEHRQDAAPPRPGITTEWRPDPGYETDSDDWHLFRRFVNPDLGRALQQMKMDKTFVRGEGCYLYDQDGERYLDFLAQYGALPFGFNPPEIWTALHAVHDRLEPSFTQPSALGAASRLAQRLIEIAPPGLRYVAFGNSGAEAVEAAIKLCRSTTGRRDILATRNAFHGKTLGALSATHKKEYQEPFGAPIAGFHSVAYGDTEALESALQSRQFAGFLVEPIQGEGGVIEPPAGYLRKAKELCEATSTLFVLDEVQTGLGRTGAMFACEHDEDLSPDVMTVAKALGGGLIPIGACLISARAYNKDFALNHTSTFAGNTLACRAGLATLDLLEAGDRALIRQVADTGQRFKAALLELQGRYPEILRQVRGRGYMLGLQFGIDRHSSGGGILGHLAEEDILTAVVVSHLLNFEGVRVGYSLNRQGILRVQPPLIATWKECEIFLGVLEKVLAKLDSRETDRLIAHIADHDPRQTVIAMPADRSAPRPALRHPRPSEQDGRFAFLVHPLINRDYAELDRKLAPFNEQQLERVSDAIADNFDPFAIGETLIRSDVGQTAYGEYLIIPRCTEQLVHRPRHQILSEVRTAAKIAKQRGAKILGLGAHLAVVTQGGLALKSNGTASLMPAITTGNSYTVAAGRQAVRSALSTRDRALRSCSAAVVGAAGAIGRALSILLAEEVENLILLGNPEHPGESRLRLLDVAAALLEHIWEFSDRLEFSPGSLADQALSFRPRGNRPTEQQDQIRRVASVAIAERFMRKTGAIELSCEIDRWLPRSDVVVTATNSLHKLITPDSLKSGAIVCDISRPSNIREDVCRKRPDVMVIDGGIIQLPGTNLLGFDSSLSEGRAYACMAETMMLALEQQYQDTSLGFHLDLAEVKKMEELADRHGFKPVVQQHQEEPFAHAEELPTPERGLGHGGALGGSS